MLLLNKNSILNGCFILGGAGDYGGGGASFDFGSHFTFRHAEDIFRCGCFTFLCNLSQIIRGVPYKRKVKYFSSCVVRLKFLW